MQIRFDHTTACQSWQNISCSLDLTILTTTFMLKPLHWSSQTFDKPEWLNVFSMNVSQWELNSISASLCNLKMNFKSTLEYLWPCITKPTKSRMAQFCVMARNRWSGSAWVIFRFWYILKEQSFFYTILKFGSIKRIISRVFCCFSRPVFLRSDGSCYHSTCPIICL